MSTTPSPVGDHERARRLRRLDAEIAQRALGFTGSFPACRPGDDDREDPIPCFLAAPEDTAFLAARRAEGLLTADGQPAPSCFVPKHFTTCARASYELQRHFLARGWLSGHQDTLVDGERRTSVHYSHPSPGAFVDATARDYLEANGHAVLRAAHEEARAAQTSTFAVLVSRPVLEDGPGDAVREALACALAATYDTDLLGPALAAVQHTPAAYVLLIWSRGALRHAEPIGPPPPDTTAPAFLRTLAATSRDAGYPVPALLSLLVLATFGQVEPITFTETSAGEWQAGVTPDPRYRDAPLHVAALCRYCGCTDARACPDGCYWIHVDPDLAVGVCSAPACVEALSQERARAAAATGAPAPDP
ncbi:MAG: hypothetical protein AB1941_00640 [Gemmatimonadota bacterium]